ncbi:S1C family serine protease [Deinococcus sp. HMF7604]|uniref:S1C family serine protease n=1 Tax=Deinococcus betulae TaxID=2873312 RepID=UPI001CD00BF2|nr:S1C family serine protease [Deinococcus betulae]
MRASPWLPVLLLLALAAYLLPDLRLPFQPAPVVTVPGPSAAPALPNQLPAATRALFEKSRPASVRVESVNPSTRNAGIGTGFFISETGQVLTAYHVVSGGRLFQVSTLSGRSYSAQVTAFDASADVALLQVRGRGPFPYLKLATRPPRVGETVLAVGNSGGDFLQPRRGQLLGLDTPSSDVTFPQGTLEMTAPLAPGDSGGPIIDGNGQAIGVVSYISVDVSGQTRRSYAVPVTEGNALIASLRAGETKDVPVVGLIFDTVHSGRTELAGGVIDGVARRSPAERAGLRGNVRDGQGKLVSLGDVIVRVNGQRTRDANAVIQAVRRLAVGDTVTLTYQRGEELREARVVLVPKASVNLEE